MNQKIFTNEYLKQFPDYCVIIKSNFYFLILKTDLNNIYMCVCVKDRWRVGKFL